MNEMDVINCVIHSGGGHNLFPWKLHLHMNVIHS